ncbi:MAG: hypothetical protein NTW18_01755 [Candidatus Omnitrophica bacterium]|nr:hypothetical protein [Candidatus Omnitrophota bacterium]
MRVTFLILISFLLFASAQAANSITLRLMAVNPSDSEQTVPIKVYLPLEVKPEDVIYRGDLEVAYDAQQGSYYVFGEYQLKPKETLEKEIEIKDVWLIDESQIALLRQEAKEVLGAFEKTKYLERATLLYSGIDKKLKEVEQMQDLSAASPGYKISNYRNSLSLLNSAKADLLAAKTLLSEVAPKGLTRFTWKIFLFIVVFLGVLGLGFFIIWQRQTKLEEEQKPQQQE